MEILYSNIFNTDFCLEAQEVQGLLLLATLVVSYSFFTRSSLVLPTSIFEVGGSIPKTNNYTLPQVRNHRRRHSRTRTRKRCNHGG
jgi:hypothetical protein